MELQAERMPCNWKTKEDMIGANLMELEQTKMGLVLVVFDDKLITNRKSIIAQSTT
jgi:hypothetical protein